MACSLLHPACRAALPAILATRTPGPGPSGQLICICSNPESTAQLTVTGLHKPSNPARPEASQNLPGQKLHHPPTLQHGVPLEQAGKGPATAQPSITSLATPLCNSTATSSTQCEPVINPQLTGPPHEEGGHFIRARYHLPHGKSWQLSTGLEASTHLNTCDRNLAPPAGSRPPTPAAGLITEELWVLALCLQGTVIAPYPRRVRPPSARSFQAITL